MSDPVVTSVQSDLSKVESKVKTDIATVKADVTADLAKTYSAKIVAIAFAAGLVLGFIIKALV
jgi:hypothetical protein